MPSATLGAGGGLATGGAAAGGAAGLGGLASGLRGLAPFASLLPAMRGAIGGSGGGGTNTQIPPELQQLLQMSMQRMTDELATTPRGLLSYPLTVTRRCGRAIVEEAKAFVPEFCWRHANSRRR